VLMSRRQRLAGTEALLDDILAGALGDDEKP
jgi:hypothetical protein